MEITKEEYQAYIRNTQIQQRQREIAHRLQEDFSVFNSYSHSDDKVAKEITDLFDRLNLNNYVIDKKELDWGDDIRKFAVDKIEQCTHYLLILSDTSAKSQWCAIEFGIAMGSKKEILFFLADDDLEVPPYAANLLATSDINLLTGYFSRDLIRCEVIESFIKEIIDDGHVELSDFEKVEVYEDGRTRWEAPNRVEIESRKREPLAAYLDDSSVQHCWSLVSIELGKSYEKEAIVLYYCNPSFQPCTYKLNYCPELGGVIVDSKKNGSDVIGVRLYDENGVERLVRRAPSPVEFLKSRDVRGWKVSRSFWGKALEVLRNQLPG